MSRRPVSSGMAVMKRGDVLFEEVGSFKKLGLSPLAG